MKIISLILLFPIFSYCQNEIAVSLQNEIEQRIAKGINHGIAAALIDSMGRVTYLNWGLENKTDTISSQSTFEIASISKTFTSTLVYHLDSLQILSIQDEIRAYLPDSLPESIKKITFYQLLNHTSGLPRLPYDYWTANWDNPFFDHTKEKFLHSLMSISIDPSGKWNYSNTGYSLLGFILDQVTHNRRLEQLIQELHLTQTTSHIDHKPTTTPHNFGKKVEYWKFPHFNRYMGGVHSSSNDLVTYLQYQIQHNDAFRTTPFDSSCLINPNDSLVSRKGWLVFHKNKEEIIWHNGIAGGSNSFIGYNIQSKVGIILLSNSQSSILDLGLHYLSHSFPLITPKIPLTHKVEYFISKNELDSVVIAWKDTSPTHFSKNPIDLYWLQCHYISKKKLKIALLLNTLLYEDYPSDWEVVFYRGKIYELMRKFTKAIKCYKKVNHLFVDNNFITYHLKMLHRTKKT